MLMRPQWLNWLWQKKEALFWIGALIFLAVSNPEVHHYTLCPLNNLGFDYCPGCGIGRSVGYFFHFDFKSSFYCHPLGIPAAILLLFRSLIIIFRPITLNLQTI
jgi:hypothetical protein